MACTGIYIVSRAELGADHADHALAALRDACARLIVVTSADSATADPRLRRHSPDMILHEPAADTSFLAGVRAGLLASLDQGQVTGPVVVTGAHVLGPLAPVATYLARLQADNAQLFAPYWHNTALDPRVSGAGLPRRVALLDFAIFAPRLLDDPDFRDFWQGFVPPDPDVDVLQGLASFTRMLERGGHRTLYALDEDQLKTDEPRLYEVHTLVEQGAPCLPLAVFTLDPLVHDLGAIDLRRALDALRSRAPEVYGAAIRHATRHVRMREFNAIAAQFEVIPVTAANPGKTQWTFGTVAVFMHVYYPEMIDELMHWVDNIPAPVHLFVTTSSEANRQTLVDFLRRRGFADDAVDVRVPEQNRGRDMSSLFITFRDVILDDRYQVALRLHSKRTPQVSHRVAENFKAHLFENMAQSPGYVANLLDRIEAEPDIGLVIPPVIHVGFGTLGHSWFNNYAPVEALVAEMGLDVPLDRSTPVAPYGTMYWFRTDALRRMFEWPWQWQDYNAEPNHVDGGLAHLQERLIGYCAQGSGYRVYTVQTPANAAYNYARLEYKMQRLVSYLLPANIVGQDKVLAEGRTRLRARLYQNLEGLYGRVLIRWPGSRARLRPIAKAISRMLSSNSGA